MLLANFKLHPLPRLESHIRIRIWDTRAEMEAAAHVDDSVKGEFQAAHCGYAPQDNRWPRIGDVYLFRNPTMRADAVHELTHAAVHYVRDLLLKDLNEPEKNGEASDAEELLCEVVEHYLGGFAKKLLRHAKKF